MHHQKFFVVCVYIKWTDLLYSLQKHGEKSGVQAVECGDEIWINQGHL